MAVHYRTQGFILKKTNRGESDRIFTIYTKDFGKLEILGKAIRKIKSKLRAGVEIFYLSEIEFIQGKTHKTLTDTILIDNFQNIRKDLKKLSIAYKISEIADRFLKGEEKDEEIWNLLQEIFDKLNNLKLEIRKQPSGESLDSFGIGRLEIIYYYFLWNLLSVLGYQLEFYHCSLCQKKLGPQGLYLNPKEGGLICNQCKETTKSVKEIESDTVKIIRILLKKEWPTLKRLKIETKDLKLLKLISDYYLLEILEEIE